MCFQIRVQKQWSPLRERSDSNRSQVGVPAEPGKGYALLRQQDPLRSFGRFAIIFIGRFPHRTLKKWHFLLPAFRSVLAFHFT